MDEEATVLRSLPADEWGHHVVAARQLTVSDDEIADGPERFALTPVRQVEVNDDERT